MKIRGVRIEPGEIEAAILRHPEVADARVVARGDQPGERRLVAFVVPRGEISRDLVPALRAALREVLPEIMVPAAIVLRGSLPLTPNGKVDVARLAREEIRPEAAEAADPVAAVEPEGELERAIAGIWREVLHLDRVERDANFFDLGGHSLLLPRLHSRLHEALGRELTLVDLFRHPTVSALARFLDPGPPAPPPAPAVRAAPAVWARPEARRDDRVAVVGMSCRFPGARDTRELWRNLRDGVESIRPLGASELASLGADPAALADPSFVPVAAMPDDIDKLDAGFFGISQRDAELMDPQHRVFLEIAWEALEDAGYAIEAGGPRVGVFAGGSASTYMLLNLLPHPDLRGLDPMQLLVGNLADYLAPRISYKLNLRGPSYNVQSACSSSLVAVHNARQSLLAGECDMALAGGVSLPLHYSAGYRYQEGSIVSPDGHCRAFDARARGTVFGGGAGLVVLKRLRDAVADGDTIRAVLLGSAVNNDGALKVGFTAPGVEGQEEVLREALAEAGVEPASLSYVEAHGTGTEVGDPIEIQALSRVLRARRRPAWLLRHRVGQDQHRTPRRGGRHRRPDQDRARAGEPADPSEPAFREPQSRHRFRLRPRSTSARLSPSGGRKGLAGRASPHWASAAPTATWSWRRPPPSSRRRRPRAPGSSWSSRRRARRLSPPPRRPSRSICGAIRTWTWPTSPGRSRPAARSSAIAARSSAAAPWKPRRLWPRSIRSGPGPSTPARRGRGRWPSSSVARARNLRVWGASSMRPSRSSAVRSTAAPRSSGRTWGSTCAA